MSDLGLPMTDPMALACHEGRKTVTRRPMSAQPTHVDVKDMFDGRVRATVWLPAGGADLRVIGVASTRDAALMDALGPAIIPGAGTAEVGGRVWIRECFAVEIGDTPLCGSIAGMRGGGGVTVRYRASGDTLKLAADGWRPSIHMPKWAARTWGAITSARPERLQDITDKDANREGFGSVDAFRGTWDTLYKARGLGWDANPWVFRIEWAYND